MKNLQGKTALVTGASSGIGEDMARVLAANGTHLILVARRAERLQALAQELAAAHGVRTDVIAMDLGAPGAAEVLHARTEGAGVAVDILINNAGFGIKGPFLDTPVEAHRDMNRLNMETLTELCWHFGRDMRARRSGWILNTASVGGYIPVPEFSTYTAGKAYVLSFGEALSNELAPDGITVTTLCPGGTWTEFMSVTGQQVSGIQKLGMMPARKVAEAGLRGLSAGSRVVVPGWLNRIYAPTLRALPSTLKTGIARLAMQ